MASHIGSPKLDRRRRWWKTVMDTRCVRCLKSQPAPDDAESIDWESVDDDAAMVCPDCVTVAEQQTIDDFDMALDEEHGDAP